MDAEQLEYFRTRLLNWRKELIAEAMKALGERAAAGQDRLVELVDIASDEIERFSRLRLRDRERKLIKKIDQTLERIDDGTFGVCDECGEDISFKRLDARPVATLCIECKEEQEALEKG